MKFSLSKILKLLISLGIGMALIWYVQKDLSISDKELILNSFRNIKLPATLVTIFLAIVACVIRALRWEMLLNPMGYSPRRLVLVSSIFVMYLANLLFPRLGEVLRCTILNEHEDIPMEKSLGTMIVERIIDVIGMGVIALIAVFLEFDKIINLYQVYQDQKKDDGNHAILFMGILLLALVLASVFTPKIRTFIVAKLMGLLDGIKAVFQLENPILFLIYSLSIYGIYFSTTYIMYHSLIGLESLQISSTFLVLTAGTAGVGISQGGIGAFQVLVTKALEMYEIPTPIGLAYSWLSWSVQTGTLIVFGFASWIYLNLKKLRNEREN